MAIARPIRALALAAVILWCFFIYVLISPKSTKYPLGPGDKIGYKHIKEPLLDCMRPSSCKLSECSLLTSNAVTGEPEGTLWRAGKGYGPGKEGTNRINATLLALVRNEELNGMVEAMHDLERTWNHKFNYPWTFFNDVPFTDEFKRRTGAATKAQCNYGRTAVIL